MKNKKDMKKGIATLALGEVSGHSHRTTSPVMFKYGSDGLAQELIIEQDTDLIHEEHDTQTLPKGEAVVTLQTEYDVIEGIRKVLD